MIHARFSHLSPGPAVGLNDEAMPFPFTIQVAAPNLIACPVHPAVIMTAQALYQAAYENALATTRTTRFELAMATSAN